MKHIVAGIVAHVDAGKTTLSEAMLYRTGELRKLGRVDNGDAFLDTDDLEKKTESRFFHTRLVFSITSSNLLYWIHRDMWILPHKRNKF